LVSDFEKVINYLDFWKQDIKNSNGDGELIQKINRLSLACYYHSGLVDEISRIGVVNIDLLLETVTVVENKLKENALIQSLYHQD